jgi:hypothetical protein
LFSAYIKYASANSNNGKSVSTNVEFKPATPALVLFENLCKI